MLERQSDFHMIPVRCFSDGRQGIQHADDIYQGFVARDYHVRVCHDFFLLVFARFREVDVLGTGATTVTGGAGRQLGLACPIRDVITGGILFNIRIAEVTLPSPV